MKHNFLCLLSAAALAATGATAFVAGPQIAKHAETSVSITENKPVGPNGTTSEYIPAERTESPEKAQNTWVEIQIDNFTHPEYETSSVTLISPDGEWSLRKSLMDDDGFGILDNVPVGDYVVVGFFKHLNQYGNSDCSVYVVKENYNTSDGMITLDPLTATQEIRLTAFTPEGLQVKLPKMTTEGTSAADQQTVVLEEGTVQEINARTTLYHPEIGELYWNGTINMADWQPSPLNPKAQPYDYRVLINPGLENILVNTRYLCAVQDQSPLWISVTQLGTNSGNQFNEPGKYILFDNKIEHTGLAGYEMELSGYPLVDKPYSFYTNTFFKGKEIKGVGNQYADPTGLGVQYCSNGVLESKGFSPIFYSQLTDATVAFRADTTVLADGRLNITTYSKNANTGSAYSVIDNQGVFRKVPLAYSAFYGGETTPADIFYRTPAAFAQQPGQVIDPAGSTPAYFASMPMMPVSTRNQNRVPIFNNQYRGNANEVVGAFASFNDVTITRNGQDARYYPEEWNGIFQTGFYGWCVDQYNKGIETNGLYHIVFDTPQPIDTLMGNLNVQLDFTATADPFTLPGIQFLQSRDKQGLVKWQFDYPEEVVINIMAGNYLWNDVPGNLNAAINGWYTPEGNLEPTLEISPFGKNDWTALQLSKTDEATPCFAPVYTAGLEGYDGASENLCFDLRISMTNEAGNSVLQTISPYIRVSSMSGINSPAVSDAAMALRLNNGFLSASGTIEIFTLQGIRVAASEESFDTTLLPAGLYIARSAGSALKFNVK